jgi:hypothetical protein
MLSVFDFISQFNIYGRAGNIVRYRLCYFKTMVNVGYALLVRYIGGEVFCNWFGYVLFVLFVVGCLVEKYNNC